MIWLFTSGVPRPQICDGYRFRRGWVINQTNPDSVSLIRDSADLLVCVALGVDMVRA